MPSCADDALGRFDLSRAKLVVILTLMGPCTEPIADRAMRRGRSPRCLLRRCRILRSVSHFSDFELDAIYGGREDLSDIGMGEVEKSSLTQLELGKRRIAVGVGSRWRTRCLLCTRGVRCADRPRPLRVEGGRQST